MKPFLFYFPTFDLLHMGIALFYLALWVGAGYGIYFGLRHDVKLKKAGCTIVAVLSAALLPFLFLFNPVFFAAVTMLLAAWGLSTPFDCTVEDQDEDYYRTHF